MDPNSGKAPRKAAELRGFLDGLAGANEQRHDINASERMEALVRERFIILSGQLLSQLLQVIPAGAHERLDTEFHRQLEWNCRITELCELAQSALRENCERCGYLLRGLPERGECPECGATFFVVRPETDKIVATIGRVVGKAVEAIKPSFVVRYLLIERAQADVE